MIDKALLTGSLAFMLIECTKMKSKNLVIFKNVLM